MDQVHWREDRARFQARVAIHENRVLTKSPVADHGIDIKKGKSFGVTGYEAMRLRREALVERRRKALVAKLDAVEKKEIPETATSNSHPTIRLIQWHVCSFSSTSRNDLLSNRRTRVIIKPRQISMMLSKMKTLASLPEIGRKHGNRDHATVVFAVKKTAELQKILLSRLRPSDDIGLWVSEAFKIWDEIGLKS